jgi:hypothetical protein
VDFGTAILDVILNKCIHLVAFQRDALPCRPWSGESFYGANGHLGDYEMMQSMLDKRIDQLWFSGVLKTWWYSDANPDSLHSIWTYSTAKILDSGLSTYSTRKIDPMTSSRHTEKSTPPKTMIDFTLFPKI